MTRIGETSGDGREAALGTSLIFTVRVIRVIREKKEVKR
jgi:hypothetical protein